MKKILLAFSVLSLVLTLSACRGNTTNDGGMVSDVKSTVSNVESKMEQDVDSMMPNTSSANTQTTSK